jgi:hypothetical protein
MTPSNLRARFRRSGLFAWLGALSTVILGCSTPPVPTTVASPPARVAAAPAVSPPSPCWGRGRPALAPSTASPAPAESHHGPACAPLFAHEVAVVQEQVRKAFVIRNPPSLLVVDFDCDQADDTLHSIVMERGSGHGGSMEIAWISIDEHATAEVRRLRSNHYATPPVHFFEQTRFMASELVPVMDRARAALVARPHLVQLSEPRNSMKSMHRTTMHSSNDFHLALRVTDAEAQSTSREFSGYDSSDTLERSVPIKLAVAPLEAFLETKKWTRDPARELDRTRFTARLVELLKGRPAWWVKEHFLALAQELATVDAIPSLVAQLARTDDAAEPRIREAVLAALAAITGWTNAYARRGVARGKPTLRAVRPAFRARETRSTPRGRGRVRRTHSGRRPRCVSRARRSPTRGARQCWPRSRPRGNRCCRR